MLNGVLALVLLQLSAGPAAAQALPAAFPHTDVRCPALIEAPRSNSAHRQDPATKYLLLLERYCRGPMEAALTEIDTFLPYEFRDRRDELTAYRARLLNEPDLREARVGGLDWFIRVVSTASMLHLDRAMLAPSTDPLQASHLNWSRELVRLLQGVEKDPSFRHDWYVAVGAFLQAQVLMRELDGHLREARAGFPDSARIALAWGMMREAEASPRILPLLLTDHATRNFATERPDPKRWLEDAERSYDRALALDPGLHEARLRRGRVRVNLTRPDAGYADLVAVRSAASGDQRLEYLATMFVGALLERSGRTPEAVDAYRAAVDLYPECQAATFALSHAVRKTGNREEASRLVLGALDRATGACGDPLWLYDLGAGPRSEALIGGLRQRVRP